MIASIGPLPKNVHPYPDSAAYSEGWTQVAGLMFGGGFIEQDANTLEYRPYAASEWNVSPDGKTFTFKLRDGREVERRQAGHRRRLPVRLPGSHQGRERLRRAGRPRADRVLHVARRPDDRRQAQGDAGEGRRDRRRATIGPVPKHIWQGKSWTDPVANPEILKPTVVCGPYILKEWNSAEGATFERNPTWFKGTPNFEKIVIKPGQQPTVAYELLKSNQAQWAPNIPPSQYTEAKQNPNLTLYEWTAANGAVPCARIQHERGRSWGTRRFARRCPGRSAART